VHFVCEALPDALVELVPAELAHRCLHPCPELGVGLLGAGDADDREPLREQAAGGERVDRREELALGQVARGAEDDECTRDRDAGEPQPLAQWVGRGHFWSTVLTACPPNWLRSAAFTFAANDSS
jgi:hypothetical protein